MKLAPKARLGLRIAIVALTASLAVVGIIALALGASGATSTNEIVPEYPVSVGVVLCGLVLFLGAFFLLLSVFYTVPKLTVAAAGICAAGTVGLLAFGFTALTERQLIYRLDAALEERWHVASNSLRLETQRSFGCCGFSGPADYYGAHWNATCVGKSLDKKTCCQGMLHWNTNATGLCGASQPLYACCSSGVDSWPCYRLEPCHGVIMAWLRNYTSSIAAYGLSAGFYALIGITLVCIGIFIVARSDVKMGIEFLEDQDDEEDGL